MSKELFAEVILPLSVSGRFTYRIPEILTQRIAAGSSVIVGFGSRKLYSGIVISISDKNPDVGELKEISDVLETAPLINEKQTRFWSWLSDYYMCTPGEVMRAALPSGLCLESETILSVNPEFTGVRSLDEDAMYLLNMVENRGTVTLKHLPAMTGDRSTIKIINDLIKTGALAAGQTISEKYSPKEENFVILSKKYSDDELNRILDSLSAAPKQLEIMNSYLRMTGYSSGADLYPVKKSILIADSGALPSSVNSLVKKGVMVNLSIETSRLPQSDRGTEPLHDLSEAQVKAYDSLQILLKEKDIVLLHGVTSSGKTELYIRLIDEQLKKGKQVLYLLPEIALTAQIISRLTVHFGKSVTVFHSRLSDSERIEIWNRVAGRGEQGRIDLVIGVRSSVFLPFRDLGLVIIDEEHDNSYKQHDPSPRYQARDSAIMMASIWEAKTVLGSATPSIESVYNTFKGKYGYVWIGERYGKVNLPEIIIANTREAYRKKRMVSHFSPQLLELMDEALAKGEQVLLFRNRRGFSPYIECSECGWVPVCTQCAVNLTYHKELNRLVCHYCGSSYLMPSNCGNCGNLSLVMKGFGTEKLEEEIKIVFPKARVTRMDQDSTRNKNSVQKIIASFESGQTDILIGTQMISKGLDFENLTVVGILNADGMLNFPDFRAHERAFQMMAQVSGRAGRREKHGRVVIQTTDPTHTIIRQVLQNDFRGMFEIQLGERKLFNYPPYVRMVRLILKHKDRTKLNEYSDLLGKELKVAFGKRVLGPESPVISRIQLWHIKHILIKIEKEKPMTRARDLIRNVVEKVEKAKGAGSLRINIDVDPY